MLLSRQLSPSQRPTQGSPSIGETRAGDLLLRKFSKAQKDCLRRYELNGRMGGEEFAVLLPSTDLAQARLTAERL